MKRDKFKCKKCGDDKTELHIHHIEYNGDPWEAPNISLETLCKHCHRIIEYFNKSDYQIVRLKKYKYVNGILYIIQDIDDLICFEFINDNDNIVTLNELDGHEFRKLNKYFKSFE